MPRRQNSTNEHAVGPQPADQRDDLHMRSADLEAQLAAAQQREVAALARIAELETQLVARNALSRDRLDLLLEICSALLVIHDVESILKLIVCEVIKLFPGTSSALLFLMESDTQHLVLRAANRDMVTNVALQPGEGVAGHAFQAPRAMLVVGPELEAVLCRAEVQQLEQSQDHLPTMPPASALLAPLRIETQRLGALILYSGTQAHLFLPRDLPFVQTLADLAAVAISEAQQRAHAAALQRDLAQVQLLHAEAQARLSTAQAQLLQSAKLAAVGELAASVAHEINNPLYAARNSLYLVEQDLPADASPRPFLEIAQNELGRIARIITRMRDFYRPTRAELAPTDVNKLLIETVELVQTYLRHNQIVVSQHIAGDLPKIIAHGDQLRQVFLNLMLNACDAMPDGGSLCITTQTCSAANQVPGISIHITDTGTGIAPEHLEHLFEPFYTTKPQGTGLGLAISAHIVTQHDGQIDVESILGAGTTFIIKLPIRIE